MLPPGHIETWDQVAGVIGALQRAGADAVLIRRVADEYARTHTDPDGVVRVSMEDGGVVRLRHIENAATLSQLLNAAGLKHRIEY